jgi:hypothetical protein
MMQVESQSFLTNLVYLSPFLCSLVGETLVDDRHDLVEQLAATKSVNATPLST